MIKGHGGIYEVAVSDRVIYSNASDCSRGFPSDDAIFEEIRRSVAGEPLSEEDMSQTNKRTVSGDTMPPIEDIKKERRESTVLNTLSSCGCSPTGDGGKSCACSTRDSDGSK